MSYDTTFKQYVPETRFDCDSKLNQLNIAHSSQYNLSMAFQWINKNSSLVSNIKHLISFRGINTRNNDHFHHHYNQRGDVLK